MSWLSDSIKAIKALKTPEKAPFLQPFPKISISQLNGAEALIFFGNPGNVLIERAGVNMYNVKFHPPFHSALSMRDGIFHNVGKFITDKLIQTEFKSNRRIDVIIYKDINEDSRREILRAAELDSSVPHTGFELSEYGYTTFIHFCFAFIKSGKKQICSEDVVKLLIAGNIKSSVHDSKHTAPWDLIEFALDNPNMCEIRTLWIGDKYYQSL
jgi:hypothetical protein